MMIGSLAVALPSSSSSASCSSALLLDQPNYKRFNSLITCSSSSSSSRSHVYIPKLEPFNRSKFDRAVKDPPLIEKSETQLADYCSTLEGEESYSCWRAYFELKDLEKETPKEELEKLIIEAGGTKSLVGCLHGVAAIHKEKADANTASKAKNVSSKGEQKEGMTIHVHIPDGLPKTVAEMEEEEKARMPDSSYTKLLRLRGKHPAWFSPVPDHE